MNNEESSENVLEKTTEAQISEFAQKLGEDTDNHYTVYIYRIVKDEDTGKTKKPFIKKYAGVEPDPAEIAEKYRGGTYLIQFIWRDKKKQQGSRAYTLDVDQDAFPPLPKPGTQNSMVAINPSMSESMQLQLMTMQSIAEVMKAAYTSGAAIPQKVERSDPIEMFTGLLNTMESSYSSAMKIQQTVLERFMTKNMEIRYGLSPEPTAIDTAAAAAGADDAVIGKYTPLVHEVVDGLKTVVSFFGDNVPKNVVEKVQHDDRFRELLKDKEALVVIGKALRTQFGDDRATRLMNTFGVKMVIKKPQERIMTPEIPAIAPNTGSKSSVPIPPAIAQKSMPARNIPSKKRLIR